MAIRNKKLLITGGAGFIGSEFVRQGVERGYRIVVADNLSYAGDLKRLKSVHKNITFYKCDISSAGRMEVIFKKEAFDAVVHFAAGTHVDRSIKDAAAFIRTNVTGTHNVVHLALKYKVKRFVHISTDEVYGQSLKGRFKETSPLGPRNPYAATKAAAEFLVNAAVCTYGLPAVIVRPSNNYGPWQYPEKFLPVVISNALKGRKIPVYGQGKQVREWLNVRDCVNGIFIILERGKTAEVYNVGSYFEKTNIETAQTILKLLKKDLRMISFVQDRQGHDFRYSVDCSKLRKLGWRPQITFAQGIQETIDWYTQHHAWVDGKKESQNDATS